MDKPLISVIIPAYNCANTIEQSIRSVLCQQVSMEIIIINDGSPDNLDEVMARYESVPEIIYLKNERNLGVAETRNRAMKLARGRYIAFLDADDYWVEGKLTKQLAVIEETGTVMCATARELMNADGTLTGRILPVKEEITYEVLLRHNSISCSSVLIRTDVAQEFPMKHEDSHEDYIMWLEVLRKYGKASGINEPLLKYRLSATGKSGNKLKSAWMTFTVYRYMGFGLLKSLACFCSYMLNGVKKYYFGGKGDKK